MAAASALRRAALLALLPGVVTAAILPEDRVDVMYHGYDGGGLQVVATASPYKETRREYGGGVDFLSGKTMIGMAYIYSDEPDYVANTARFGISQDFFGDLTTLSISYARGWNDVLKNGDPTFDEHAKRQDWRVDLSQVMTPNWVLNFGYEGIVDDGYLHDPYRSARYLDSSAPKGYSYEPEVTPGTRNSSAWAIRSMYYLPYRASVRTEYRHYSDSWGIDAWNAELGYVQPLANGLTFEVSYRYYTQDAADFYSDLYPYADSQNFLSRDKELSKFYSNTFGLGLTYAFNPSFVPFFKTGQISIIGDYIDFHYDQFRNVLKGGTPGQEPMYQMDATTLRAFVSFWY